MLQTIPTFEIVVKFVTIATILMNFVNYCNFHNCRSIQHYLDFVIFSTLSKSVSFSFGGLLK